MTALQKILVIRFSSIGDIVLTTPVIRCLKNQLDHVEVHVLTKQQFGGIYLSNPYVDKVIEYSGSMIDTIRELKREQYSYIVDLHRNIRSKRVCKALRRPSFTFDKLDFKKFLFTKFKIDRLPDVHVVDRYFEAVDELDVENDGMGLDFFISDVNNMQEPDIPEEFRNGFYAVVIGGSYPTKVLPNEKFVEIIEKLDEPVILLGGSADMANAKAIADAVGGNVGNPVGKLNIEQSASIIKMAKKVLTGDTGMMHIAAALRKPIVSVWGNTVPKFGMYPYIPNEPNKSRIIECNGLKCRPCSKLGYKKCPKGHFKCMMDIDVDAVVKALKED